MVGVLYGRGLGLQYRLLVCVGWVFGSFASVTECAGFLGLAFGVVALCAWGGCGAFRVQGWACGFRI